MDLDSGTTKAVLIFAASLSEDLRQRKLQKKFSPLVSLPSINRSVTSSADIHIFTTDSELEECNFSEKILVHLQHGTTFGERLTHAIAKLSKLGYREIVIVGRDCPELESRDIHLAFKRLHDYRVVLGPDHRGGCYLIGIHAADLEKLSEVKWQQNTDCSQLQEIYGSSATFLLSVKHDIDSVADVRLLARTNSKFGVTARALLQQLAESTTHEIEPAPHFNLSVDAQRPFWQLPPPITT
ncbi:MAG: hypothetical protein C5B54_09095 [Acidobacteria bacterium]|nr:MAG: hypothetical protein C5B54_09095 [Acidobacteriota bacterium]